MSNEKKPFNLFNFIHGRREREDDLGHDPLDVNAPRDIIFFFKLFWRRVNNIFSLNFLFIAGNFPFIFLLFAMSGLFSQMSTTPASPLFPNIYGALHGADPTPYTAAFNGIFGVQRTIFVNTTVTYIFYGIGALTILTFGVVSTGISFVMRNITKGEYVFVWQEFSSAVKKNWKQGLILGVFDIAFIAMCIHNIIFFSLGEYGNFIVQNEFIISMFFFFMLFVAIFYLFARMHMYLLAVTFELSVPKILKNSFILSMVGLKRNVLGLLGIVVVLVINIMLFEAFPPIGMVAPVIITFSLLYFIMSYTAWPNIERIMIEPYYHADGTPREGTVEAD
ncbi:MAG: DUF624 domain-containing protein [Oscillospiraceae bacterium]|nr:DUF624 domain-containing protein [Oscillospiraceae bacterium]